MKKTRKRVLGGWASLCSTFIAQLAGVSAPTARRFLRAYGSAKNNTITLRDIQRFVFIHQAKQFSNNLRKDLPGRLPDDIDDLVDRLQQKGSKP